MTIQEAVNAYLAGKPIGQVKPMDYCPNCWGHQTYSGQFRDKLSAQRVDPEHLVDHKGWIIDYAVKHFEGIKLKETDNIVECPSCKLVVPDN